MTNQHEELPAALTHHRLDASGLVCPLPVLRARRSLEQLAPGELMELVATDAAALRDVPAFCKACEHHLISVHSINGVHVFIIERGKIRQAMADPSAPC